MMKQKSESIVCHCRRRRRERRKSHLSVVFVLCLSARKRPRKELDQQSESRHGDVTAAAAPKRRVIKLTSIKELRAEVSENTHKGRPKTRHALHVRGSYRYLVLNHSSFFSCFKLLLTHTAAPMCQHRSSLFAYTQKTGRLFFCCLNPSARFASYLFIFFCPRSARNAAEPLFCWLCQPSVGSNPASHQAVPAKHHHPQVKTHVATLLSLLLFFFSLYSSHCVFASQSGALLPNPHLRLWKL